MRVRARISQSNGTNGSWAERSFRCLETLADGPKRGTGHMDSRPAEQGRIYRSVILSGT